MFSLLLLVGVFVISGRQVQPPAPGLVATRAIVKGALLLPGDVAPRHDAPQYATRDIKKAEAVKAGDLSDMPPLALGDTGIPVVFTVARSMIDANKVNAGAKVRVCKDKDVNVDATVKTVICGEDRTQCLAVVTVGADKAADLGKAFSKAPLPHLQPADAAPPC